MSKCPAKRPILHPRSILLEVFVAWAATHVCVYAWVAAPATYTSRNTERCILISSVSLPSAVAQHIARECGILPADKQTRTHRDSCGSNSPFYGSARGRQRSDENEAAQDMEMGESSLGFISMEGPEFRAMPEAEALRMLPRLRVSAFLRRVARPGPNMNTMVPV